MDEKEIKILGKFYNKLCNSIRKNIKKSTKNESLIIIFLGTTGKAVYKVLQECSIPAYNFKKDESSFIALINKSFLREGEKSGEYIITSKGIWEYEKIIKKSGLKHIFNFIDKKYYSSLFKGQDKPFNAKEKVVIFGMIAVRSLSKGQNIDLSDEMNLSNYWTKIFNKSKEILLKLGVIKQSDYDIFWKERDDDVIGAVQYLMSHINELPGKTKNIYHNPGKRKYFLDIPKNHDLIKSNLKFLLQKVLNGNEINESDKSEILEFFKNMSFDYSIYIFEEKDDFYFNSDFYELLENLILFL